MPTYDYYCPACKLHWEALNKIAERDAECCGICGKVAERPMASPLLGEPRKTERLITEGQAAAEYGKDWRETPGSRRMSSGEPERIYMDRGRKG